jgi:hypothetical protein
MASKAFGDLVESEDEWQLWKRNLVVCVWIEGWFRRGEMRATNG